MAISLDYLHRVPYFATLETSEIEAISRLVFEKSFPKGEMLTWEGGPAEALYFIVAGAVKCFKTSEEGKDQIIQILFPGDSFNDVAILDGAPSPASMETMSPVNLYGISRKDMQVILRDYPGVVSAAVRMLAGRIRHLLELIGDLSFHHVINRIARLLLEYAGNGAGTRPRLTQQEMAAIVGTAREVVGRSLKTLEEEGLIRLERNRLVIADREALQRMASAAGSRT